MKIFVLPMCPEGTVLRGHIMLMLCVLASHHFQILPKLLGLAIKCCISLNPALLLHLQHTL